MPIHVAILKRRYVEAILAGTKTVESRLSKVRCAPHGQVVPGERLFMKVSGGPFLATAIAGPVLDLEDQTPGDIDRLSREWNDRVGGDAAYWESKRASPFVTMVELTHVEPLDVGPRYRPAYMRAWYVLPDAASPLLDIPLTGGAIRNGYLSLPDASERMRRDELTLHLPDGRAVVTRFAEQPGGGHKPILQWRGWRRYYAAAGLRVGDTVRLVALGDRHYAVRFLQRAPTMTP